ncbi:MAG: GGDEF domain-containing protein [Myxococcales bacterium]|nr:GGDEF domain-containing protein [Myxococcales bacterium]MCB9553153.1 GGDEF domain-containing protein [Myxococcales bacterium]
MLRLPAARLLATLWPAALPLAAAGWTLHSGLAPPAASALWVALPPLLLGAAALLGARFARGRVVLAALLIAGGGYLAASAGAELRAAIVVAVALDLLALAWLREAGSTTPAGLMRFALLAAQGAGLVALAADPAPLAPLMRPLFALPFPSPLPPAAWIALAVALVGLTVRLARTRGPVESGLAGALVAFALALHAQEPRAAAAWLAAAGLALLLAGVEISHHLAYRDQLTGLPGRRALDETLRGLRGRYVVAMVDVDHFKKFNDRHGHDAGDQALCMVAERLARVRGGGRAFRYGGEEFTLVFPRRTLDAALPHIEAVRVAVAERPFTVRGADRPKSKRAGKALRGKAAKGLRVTVSIGAAERGRRQAVAEVLAEADKRLYASKKAGRNRVTAA